MIPFVLGLICGFLFAIFLLLIYAVIRSSSEMSRNEESWNEQEEIMDESNK